MSLRDEFRKMGEWAIGLGRREERVDVLAYLWNVREGSSEDNKAVILFLIRGIKNGDHIKEQP
jgi:hypothetical protein